MVPAYAGAASGTAARVLRCESGADYAQLRAGAVELRFDFGTVRFAGYEALLDLKLLAGRDADLIDVRALREARGE